MSRDLGGRSHGNNVDMRPCWIVFSRVHLRLPEIDSALQKLSEILQQLTNQKSSVEEKIHTTFSELQKMLDVRKSVLLMEVEVNYTLKHKVRAAAPSHTFIIKGFSRVCPG